MSGKKPDPFDHTVIIPGVPEMPAETTLTLQPAPIPSTESPSVAPAVPASKPRGKEKTFGLWAAVLLVLTGGMTWWFLRSEASGPPTATAAASLPPPLQSYLDAAKHGDPKAMRMLGASYTYGLGVRADRTEGAAWYRKAAEAGDRTAEAELRATSVR